MIDIIELCSALLLDSNERRSIDRGHSHLLSLSSIMAACVDFSKGQTSPPHYSADRATRAACTTTILRARRCSAQEVREATREDDAMAEDQRKCAKEYARTL